MTAQVAILAYGSLIDDPGDEIARATVRVIEGVQTPFHIEFARSSGTRGGAPTLVPVAEGGAPVQASLLVLDSSENEAASMLWRRETRRVGSGEVYVKPTNPGRNSVLVERVSGFEGIDVVLYTSIAPTIQPLTAEKLAELAIASVLKAERGKDGISYLMAAKQNRIATALSPSYELEILKETNCADLCEAREKIWRAGFVPGTHADLKPLFDVVREDELKELRERRFGARPHPYSTLLGNLTNPSQAARNTSRAAAAVSRGHKAWLDAIKARIKDETDAANAASALAELRAFGALLEGGFNVTPLVPGDQPSPEFEVDAGDGTKIIVEVHAKQFDKATQRTLNEASAVLEKTVEETLSARRESGENQPFITTSVTEVTPFGEPNPDKPGDTITANAISRLCAIKQREHQFSADRQNILWLDLQDDYSWNLALEPEAALPVGSWNGIFYSGALWYAHYGWKGAPIFENTSETLGGQKSTPMGHDGRFRLSNRVSGVIVSFPQAVILLEAFDPRHPLTPEARLRIMNLPWAKAELSVCNWSEGVASGTVEAQRAAIEALQKIVSS